MISIAIELDPNGHPTRSFRPKLMAPPRWRPLHKAAVHGDVKELDRARAAPSFDVCFLKLFSSKFFLFPLSLFFIGTTGGPIIASNLAFSFHIQPLRTIDTNVLTCGLCFLIRHSRMFFLLTFFSSYRPLPRNHPPFTLTDQCSRQGR